MKVPEKVKVYLGLNDEVVFICRRSALSIVRPVSHRVMDLIFVNFLAFFFNWTFSFTVDSLYLLFFLNFFPGIWLAIIIYIWQNTYFMALQNQNRNGGKLVKVSLGLDNKKVNISSGRGAIRTYQTFFLKWIWKTFTGDDLIYLDVKIEDGLGINAVLVPRDLDIKVEYAFSNTASTYGSGDNAMAVFEAISKSDRLDYISREEAREAILDLLNIG